MNWITKFIKPKIKSLFEKKSSKIDENLWTTCGCKNLIYKEDLQSNLKCCPKCGAHHKLSCRERFDIFFDSKEYELIESPLPMDDPLKFEDNKKEEQKNINTVLLLNPKNEEANYLLMEIELKKSNYSKVRELAKNFKKFCIKLCDKENLILESLKDLEPKNES